MIYAARIQEGVVAEVVSLPDHVDQLIEVAEDGSPVYENRSSTLADFFHPDAGFVEASEVVMVGMTYAGGLFGPAPVIDEPEREPKRRFSFLEFMNLFTDAEQLALAGAAMTDAATKLWYDRAVGAQFISLDDARLTAGLDAMVTAGLLTAGRRDRVLQGLGFEV